MASSTAKGIADYCILLSVQQTLRHRGIDFLDFLRSGRTELEADTTTPRSGTHLARSVASLA